jgi:hypothetical protein
MFFGTFIDIFRPLESRSPKFLLQGFQVCFSLYAFLMRTFQICTNLFKLSLFVFFYWRFEDL